MEATVYLTEGKSHTVRLPHMTGDFVVMADRPQKTTDEKLIQYLRERPQFRVECVKDEQAPTGTVDEDRRAAFPGERGNRFPAKKSE